MNDRERIPYKATEVSVCRAIWLMADATFETTGNSVESRTRRKWGSVLAFRVWETAQEINGIIHTPTPTPLLMDQT